MSRPVTSPLPAKRHQSMPVRVVASYLDNWAMRRSGADTITVFARPDSDVIVGLLHLALLRRFSNPVARAAAHADLVRHCALSGGCTGPTPNIAGYALVVGAREMAIGADGAAIEEALALGSGKDPLSTLIGMAWRLGFLAELRMVRDAAALDAEAEQLSARLTRAAATFDGDALRDRAAATGAAGRLAQALAVAGTTAGLAELTAAATALTTAAVGLLSDEVARETHTAHLAQLLVAADACGLPELRARIAGLLLPERIGEQRPLLTAHPGGEKYETSGWAPMAVSVGIDDADVGQLELVFDPPAPEPPGYEVVSAEARGSDLEVVLRGGGRTAVRRFRAADFDLLLAQVLAQLERLEPGGLSPRLHGHVAVGLLELLDRAGDDETAAAIERQIRRSLDEILQRQEPTGGWQYARTAPSVIYSAGSAAASEFPDHQYTIDAAVPGIALTLASARWAEPRFVQAAELAFAFLERDVGRVDWDGRPVWRLYPDDEKTVKQGTAVNYEVWVGFFLASLSAVTEDAEIKARARRYIDDIVEYTATHLHPTGDIGYGDYVRELRTPYASWDAYLLAEIDHHVGHPGARDMSRRIVARVGDIQLASGAIPNIVDFAESFGDLRRWIMHRHGVGPYPLRAYYLMYYVGAAAAARTSGPAATKALTFVLVEMVRTTFGDMSTGYFADGRFDDRPDSLERVGRDWLLTSMAALPQVADVDYRPSLRGTDPPATRALALIAAAWRDAVAACELEGWPGDAVRELERGRAALATCSDPEINAALATMDDVLPEPAGPEIRAKTDHPARLAEAVAHHAGPGGRRDLLEAGLSRLFAWQAETGLWAMRHRPDGDERQVDVLLALLEVRERLGRPDAELDAALRRGIEGAWRELFNPAHGAAYQVPRARRPMQTRLAFRHVLAFVLGEERGLGEAGLVRARAALRHALLTRTDWDGRLVVEPDREASEAVARAQIFRALASAWVMRQDLVAAGAEVDLGLAPGALSPPS